MRSAKPILYQCCCSNAHAPSKAQLISDCRPRAITCGDLLQATCWNAKGCFPFLGGARAGMSFEVRRTHFPLCLWPRGTRGTVAHHPSRPQEEGSLRDNHRGTYSCHHVRFAPPLHASPAARLVRGQAQHLRYVIKVITGFLCDTDFEVTLPRVGVCVCVCAAQPALESRITMLNRRV